MPKNVFLRILGLAPSAFVIFLTALCGIESFAKCLAVCVWASGSLAFALAVLLLATGVANLHGMVSLAVLRPLVLVGKLGGVGLVLSGGM